MNCRIAIFAPVGAPANAVALPLPGTNPLGWRPERCRGTVQRLTKVIGFGWRVTGHGVQRCCGAVGCAGIGHGSGGGQRDRDGGKVAAASPPAELILPAN